MATSPDRPDLEGRDTGRRGTVRAGRVIVACLVGVVVLFVGGFLYFAAKVGSSTNPADPRADGIVVLTGGAERRVQVGQGGATSQRGGGKQRDRGNEHG